MGKTGAIENREKNREKKRNPWKTTLILEKYIKVSFHSENKLHI